MMLYLVVVQDSFSEGLVQHLPIPVLKPLRFGDLLLVGMTVEDVVIPFTWWTRPNVALSIASHKHRPKG